MKLSRLFLVISLILIPTGWLNADTIDPTHFFFNLNDSGSDPGGAGGWFTRNDGNEIVPGSFFVNNFNGGHPTAEQGFRADSITISCDEANFCSEDHESELLSLPQGDDPHMGLSLGGKSTPENGPFTFFADAAGGGAGDGNNPDGEPFRFQNVTGFHISSLEVDTSVATTPGQTLTFVCDGTAFASCGFAIGTGDVPIRAFFFDGTGIDSGSVPEPSTWLLFGTAALALLGRRALKRS